jgi:hypothetical protein
MGAKKYPKISIYDVRTAIQTPAFVVVPECNRLLGTETQCFYSITGNSQQFERALDG